MRADQPGQLTDSARVRRYTASRLPGGCVGSRLSTATWPAAQVAELVWRRSASIVSGKHCQIQALRFLCKLMRLKRPPDCVREATMREAIRVLISQGCCLSPSKSPTQRTCALEPGPFRLFEGHFAAEEDLPTGRSGSGTCARSRWKCPAGSRCSADGERPPGAFHRLKNPAGATWVTIVIGVPEGRRACPECGSIFRK